MTDELEGEYEPYHMHFMPFEGSLVLNIIPEERSCLGVVPAEFYELDVDEDGLIKSKKPTNPREIAGKLGDLLLVAGELATYKPGFEGCVGGIVSKFEPYIPILGIKGAVFPLNEYLEDFVAQGVVSVPFEKWIRSVHERIYHQAVSLNQILSTKA